MRVLIVSSYPPRPCGIGAYAAAQARGLAEDGHRVTVVSPPDGDGDVRVGFSWGRPFLAAARLGGGYDRIVVHFQPALYAPPRAPLAKIAASLGLLWLCLRRRRTEVLVHEADPPRLWRPDYLLLALAFRAAPALLFHTAREREALERAYRVRVRGRLVRHADGVRLTARLSRAEARRRLGLPPREPILLCAGFLHPDKGFERALEAFSRAGEGRLYVVGAVRDPTPANRAYAEALRAAAAGTPGVELVERFVSDEEFDAWLAAADALLLPYRRAWSSGALARAQAVGTPAVVSDVGGLAEQASVRDLVVRDDAELAAAVARLVGAGEGVAP